MRQNAEFTSQRTGSRFVAISDGSSAYLVCEGTSASSPMAIDAVRSVRRNSQNFEYARETAIRLASAL